MLLVERLLVGEVGSPTALARTLQGLGDPGTDPMLSTLALMALLPRRSWATSCSSWRCGHSPRCPG
jgi:hypothetical protein